MNVGHGMSTLPVHRGEHLGGYIGRTKGLQGSLEPLEVHALSFADESGRFVLVVADVVCVNYDLVTMIRARLAGHGMPHVWVAATHTHSGPETGCLPGGASTPLSVAERLIEAAVQAAEEAVRDEEPCYLHPFRAWTTGVADRRNVFTSGNSKLPIDGITVQRQDGSRAGTLIVAPIHPTVFGEENLHASADLPGGIRRAAADGLGGWAVAATGAAGDVSTRTTRRARTTAEIDRLGAEIVTAVAQTEQSVRLPVSDALTALRPNRRTVTLAPNPGSSLDKEPPVDGTDPFAARRHLVLRQGLELIASLGRSSDHPVQMPLEAVRLGSVDLIAVPGEPYLDLGEAIRTRSDIPTITLGYTNGYIGYLPSAHAGTTYETVVSPVAASSAPALINAALECVSSTRGLTPERKS